MKKLIAAVALSFGLPAVAHAAEPESGKKMECCCCDRKDAKMACCDKDKQGGDHAGHHDHGGHDMKPKP